MKKIDIFTIAALTVTLLPVSCQMEEPAEELTYTLNVPIVFGDNPTTEEAEAIIEVKADVDGTSGVTTWTTGDQIAYYVSGAGANKYQVKTINGTIVPVSLTSSQSRGDFAVYPPASANATYHTAANLKVKYPTTYDFSGMTALQMATFSPLPMVGDNTQPNIVLYNVGGLLRLTVNNVPAAAKYIKVTVPGINITGDYTVSTPASTTPSVTATTGSNDNVTFQIAETTIGTQGNYTVNLPLPAGDYSGVTGKTITVEALNGSSSSIAAANGAITHWTTLGRRKGKKLTVDFAPANFGINEGETTIWKSQTANFTTNAAGGSVTWNSSTPAVATVNASGTVTGVSAGYTDITATLNGIKVSDPVRVYVNTFSVSSVAAAMTTIGPGTTTSVTATLNHTNFGTILAFPSDLSVVWTSSEPTYVTVATPSSVNVGTLQSVTTATGGTVGSSSTITASVPTYGTSTANCSITCKLVADLTFPSGGEKYKFRGYYMHPGVLFWNGSSLSITDGTDPLELLQHYYYDSQTTKFDGSEGTAWTNCCYFTWTELSGRLTTSAGTITGTVHANDAATGNHDWRIPTLTSSTAGELGKILSDAPSYPIQINYTSAVEDNTRNCLFVNVKLPTTGPYAKKGLGYYGTYSNNSAGNKAYQAGMLLVPDGAHLTCPGMNSSSGYGNSNEQTASTTYNVIDYDDLLILVDKGCVFLPAAGYYGGGWSYGGNRGIYWSASQYGNDAYRLIFFNDSFQVSTGLKSIYFPVRLVRE